MVTKDNANSGSGGKTTCVKKQKCMMNNSQKAGTLYRDSQKTIFEPELTLEVTADDAGRKTNPVAANGVIETAVNEQTCNVWSISNLQNLKEMQYLYHETEDSLIDPSLDIDKSSLMGFIDSSNLESSEDVQTVPCIQVDVKTDVVLIDEDDDDLSLRERTVTDVSSADGNAAELVCGRLQSISSDSSHSLCDGRSLEQGSTIETPQEKQEPPKKHKRSCCLCVII
ncbi:paralemmin-2-like [Sinocyclocheilus anshuiensis]|uniref:paralemmin-2-like n=1 Tax=Sinocyclocheilus anshuiensis TaxID=1608454 RepID=UPI0007BA458E|nr:PREDICTED: paralemmin-2-like [Sinocyclocheilus anshuiensis]